MAQDVPNAKGTPHLVPLDRLFQTTSDKLFGSDAVSLGIAVDNVVIPVLLLGTTNSVTTGAVPSPLVGLKMDTLGQLLVNTTGVSGSGLKAVITSLNGGSGAGNAPASVVVPSPTGNYTAVEVLAVIYSYNCDATVATRTTAPCFVQTGLKVEGTGNAGQFSMADTLSLTAGQYGSVMILPNGIRDKNQNGTHTLTTNGGPCPFWSNANLPVRGDAAAATNGVAGDAHSITFLYQLVS